MRVPLVAVYFIVFFSAPANAQIEQLPEPPKSEIADPFCNRQVKSRTIFNESTRDHEGQVIKIDEKEMQVMVVPPLMWTYRRENGIEVKHLLPREKPHLRVFRPIDVLASGRVLDGMLGNNSYLWKDIQKGDTIAAYTVNDKDEKIDYVVQIRLERRPGGKIPDCQNPSDRRVPYHVKANVRNDIENGLDVTEEAIREAFPYKPYPSGPRLPANVAPPTDELPKEYREKLEANRKRIAEEKAKGLKAKPVDKKDDKK